MVAHGSTVFTEENTTMMMAVLMVFIRTLRNFFVLCTFGEELELESTVKKISYFTFIDFGGSIKEN